MPGVCTGVEGCGVMDEDPPFIYPVQQPGQCDCGEFHNGWPCWNVVREDDDSWQVIPYEW